MNRVYNLTTRIHSPLKTRSPRRIRKQMVSSKKIQDGSVEGSRIQRNPSLICLEKILKLPKINKDYKVDIIDDHFTIRYFENKKRVELTYRQRNPQEIQEPTAIQLNQEERMEAGMC